MIEHYEALVLLLLFSTWHLRQALSEQLPHISCPDEFEYISQDSHYIGRITLSDLPFTTINLEVTFSQQAPLESNFRGRLSFEHDLLTTQKKMENGDPITYLVDFPDSNMPPKLISLVVNSLEICSSSDYPDPKVTFSLQRSFSPSVGSHRRQEKQETSQSKPTPRNISQDLDSICGLESNGTATKLIDGRVPWLVRIGPLSGSSLKYLCTGSLVSARTVLTVAHCLAPEYSTTEQKAVVLGQYSTSGLLVKKVASMVTHPDYGKYGYPDADVGLLHLQSAVSFTDDIRPICLWSGSDDVTLVEGVETFTTTWGGIEHLLELVNPPKILDIVIVSHEECLELNDNYKRELSPRSFCAGGRIGKGSCTGDSGNALVINENGRLRLRAILSSATANAKGECHKNEYVVYCDVAKHTSWVQKNMLI